MILGGRPTNPGELRTPVTLLKRTITTAAGGFQMPGTTTILAVKARWVNVHGSEVWAASVVAQDAATVLIRYNSQVDTTCLVSKGGKLYEIVSVDDIEERHEYMELKVRRAEEG